MPSPTPGKRYGVTYNIMSPLSVAGVNGTAYGSSLKVAMARAGELASRYLKVEHNPFQLGLIIFFTITERPSK